jgi:predicted ATPase/DNA-binding SARP family transcriptional activator
MSEEPPIRIRRGLPPHPHGWRPIDTPWQVELLGWLRVAQGDRLITRFQTRKTAALLAYLAYYRHRSHPRGELVELLWPECDPAAGSHRLCQALYSLRCQLEPPGMPAGVVILANRVTVQLNPAACVTDVAQFEAALHAAEGAANLGERVQRLAAAAELYRGELLPGFYEEWLFPERQRLAEAYLQALHEVVALLEQAGDLPRALPWARRAVAVDPLREESQYQLIRLLAAAGQREAARQQYAELERLLAQELGSLPSPEIRALLDAMAEGKGWTPCPLPETGAPQRSGEEPEDRGTERQPPSLPPEPAAGEVEAGPPVSGSSQIASPAPAGHLPLQFTRFFGREHEIERLGELLLGVETRLVTLTGPGGMGKTRLGIQTAQSLRDAFPGGVWFVPLLGLSDPELIAEQVVRALGLPRSPQLDPLDQAVAFLCRQPALLLLDNFEHLVEGGVETVQALLEPGENLTVLVTSRRRLALDGEREFPVGPLPVPVGRGKLRVESPTKIGPSNLSTLNFPFSTLMQCPSLRLFVDRAQAVRPDFQVTPGNAAAVMALCHRLEGLPLALELAAARCGVLAPSQMLVRLQQRFDLLVRHGRASDLRHRGLRAALDWSFQLLSPELQRFFVRLSVFRGGWTLEAAERVCAGGGNALEELEQLRECSLVLVDEGPEEMRCRLLETLREYADEQLASEERGALQQQHAHHYLALAEEAGPQLLTDRLGMWLDRLEIEYANLRAALAWLVENGQAKAALRFATAVWPFWRVRGHHQEGREWIERALARTREQPTDSADTQQCDDPGLATIQARALYAAGELAWLQGELDAARVHLEESIALGRGSGDVGTAARSLLCLWMPLGRSVDDEAKRALVEEGLAIGRELGDRRIIASALGSLGGLACGQSDYEAAWPLFEESLRLVRELGDPLGLIGALSALGGLATREGNYGTARSLLEETLDLRLALRDDLGIAGSYWDLGNVEWHRGDFAAAGLSYQKSLTVYLEGGHRYYVLCKMSLERLAEVANGLGQPGRAVRLLAAAAALRDAAGAPLPPADRAECERHLACARTALGEEAFAAAWTEGRTLTWEQAAAEALAEM